MAYFNRHHDILPPIELPPVRRRLRKTVPEVRVLDPFDLWYSLELPKFSSTLMFEDMKTK